MPAHEPRSSIETYIENARRRARRRKSPLNFLLLLHWPVAFLLWYAQTALFFGMFHEPCQNGNMLRCLPQEGGWVVVGMVAPLFPALPLSMLAVNAALRLIPPVRRVFDAEAQDFPETGYARSQRRLAAASAVLCAAGGLLSLLAFSKM